MKAPILTTFIFTDVHNNFAMLEPDNNFGKFIVRKNVDRMIDHLLETKGQVDVLMVGGDLISDYPHWNQSSNWPYKYFVEYRRLLVDTFKRLAKDGKVIYAGGNHDYALGELATDGPGKNGSYNSFDFYFGDAGMKEGMGELPEEDMYWTVGEHTGEKYLHAYYYEVNGVGFIGLSPDHDKIWSKQGGGFNDGCIEWLVKKLGEVDPDGNKVIFINCHYHIHNRHEIEADGTNVYSPWGSKGLIPLFSGHRNLVHVFGHDEVWHSDTTARYVNHYKNGQVLDVTGKEKESTEIVSCEERDFTSVYGGHFRPDANVYKTWFEDDWVSGNAGFNGEKPFTHRSTATPRVGQGLYIEVYDDRVVFTMKNIGDAEGFSTGDLIEPYTMWLNK